MKAVQSMKLRQIIDDPHNRKKLRRFIAIRSPEDAHFKSADGNSFRVEFVVEKGSDRVD